VSQRVLVTGGHGFLGSWVSRGLAQHGLRVEVPSRRELDVTEASHWDRLPAGFDAVVHAAAYVPASPTRPEDVANAIEVGARGTHLALEWAAGRRVTRFVYCSSADVYARGGPIPVPERAALEPSGAAVYYGLGKLWGEQLARAMRGADRLGTVSLRFAQLHGHGMRPRGVVAAFVDRARRGEAMLVNAPDASGDFLYVADAVQAVVQALSAAAPGPVYNIGSGAETTLVELATAVWGAFRSDPPRIEVGEQEGVRFALDVGKARAELGYSPAFDLARGLADWKTLEGAH